MMLCVVIRIIGWSRRPIDMKLILINTVLNPIETHVHGLGTALFDLAIGKTRGRGVIHLDWRGGVVDGPFLLKWCGGVQLDMR